jgi:hypothetical protein
VKISSWIFDETFCKIEGDGINATFFKFKDSRLENVDMQSGSFDMEESKKDRRFRVVGGAEHSRDL